MIYKGVEDTVELLILVIMKMIYFVSDIMVIGHH